MKRGAAAVLLLLCFLAPLAFHLSSGEKPRQNQADAPFFPASVWYGGGRARAPMLEPLTADSRRAWREDLLLKIKSLGFNTVRTWSNGARPSHAPANTTSSNSNCCFPWPKKWA